MQQPGTPDQDDSATMYLPAARDGPETVERQRRALFATPLADSLDDMPMLVMATNDKRQIVWMNRRGREIVGMENAMGMRPGEALGCIHSRETPGGCGTTSFCEFCGSPSAIMDALAGATTSKECVIQLDEAHDSDTLDLLLWTKPVEIGGERLVLLAAYDISDQKRHEVLEKVFYHDIGNTVGGIRAILDLVEDDDHPSAEYLGLLRSATDQLIEEIDSQRALKAAEQGKLATESQAVSAREVIGRAMAMFEYQLYGKDIRIEFDASSAAAGAKLVTDPALLRRVIVNMFKNALEASGRHDIVRVGLEEGPDTVSIWVWNAASMSRETGMRIFQRSYSTKGRGRGIGTYGMKLLTERYLRGSVSFVSEEGSGTTFRITVPKDAGARSLP